VLKSANGRVILNRLAGLIFATDFPRNLDAIRIFLETVESAVHRQVVIEARIVEVKLNQDSQSGVNWTAVLGNVLHVEQALGTGAAFQIGVTHGDFNALLTALSTVGNVNVLSSPTVSTLNNQPAVIRVGTQDVFFTTTTQVDPRTGTIVQTAVTPSAINEGIVLDVTPQISDDGIITMNIHPTITERTGQATSPRGDTVPIVDVRETDTVVRIQEGQTVMIAGLISDRQLETVNKVPFLGDVPIVGGLFRRTSKENRKTDLVILMTPRVLNVRTAVDYTRSRIEEQERLRLENR
jgi:MSHA type pilus biogenesis protein MshL